MVLSSARHITSTGTPCSSLVWRWALTACPLQSITERAVRRNAVRRLAPRSPDNKPAMSWAAGPNTAFGITAKPWSVTAAGIALIAAMTAPAPDSVAARRTKLRIFQRRRDWRRSRKGRSVSPQTAPPRPDPDGRPVNRMQPGANPVRKVSIIPRGHALGITLSTPEDDRYGYSAEYLRGRIIGALGSMAAQQEIF